MMFPARSLLACWLTVVATGAVVHHQHTEPDPGHGFGWITLTSAPAETGPVHRHLVLFGVESGEIPTTDSDFGDEGSRVGPATDTPIATEANASTPNSFSGPTPSVFASAPVRAAFTTPPVPPSACPLVSHSRTGVLRS